MSEFNVVRIMDLVESIGENSVKEILSDFSCEYEEGNRNAEVEEFLRKNAIEFSRRKMSITYLVMDDELQVYGYFTLTHKPIVIQDTVLKSKNTRKKLMRYAKFDDELGVYSLSTFLIAQFSKNYNIQPEDHISGVDLMDLTLTYIEDIQEQIGGGVVFLESEDHEGLLNFYERVPNSFVPFSVRYSDVDQTKYIQLMRFFKEPAHMVAIQLCKIPTQQDSDLVGYFYVLFLCQSSTVFAPNLCVHYGCELTGYILGVTAICT